MIQLKRILFPTDFSDYSADAQRYACALAEQFDAELHLLHVLEFAPSGTPAFGGGLALSSYVKESTQRAENRLAEMLDPEWEEGRQVTRVIGDGPPFLEIVRYARQNEIDLIVMGTHGRSGLAHMMIGSVAERVVRKGPCPVLTVRPSGHEFVMP